MSNQDVCCQDDCQDLHKLGKTQNAFITIIHFENLTHNTKIDPVMSLVAHLVGTTYPPHRNLQLEIKKGWLTCQVTQN